MNKSPEKSPATGRHRASRVRRKALYGLLGDLPDRNRPIAVRKIDEEERQDYVLETLALDLNGVEIVPAYFVRPRGVSGRLPTVLFNHSHGGDYDMGKDEFLRGRHYLQPKPYAEELTENGWAGLCIDNWVFGERSHTSESDTFKAMLWQGQVLWGMMVYDSLRAVDYLSTRCDVDPQRIATLGMSMGSTMAWWLAALDERVRVTVDICCLTDFSALLREKGLGNHGVYYYVPRLLKYFSTADINVLIAPRAHLAVAGTTDPLTPVDGLDTIEKTLNRAYSEQGAAGKWRLLRYDEGHRETAAAREAIVSFLRQHL